MVKTILTNRLSRCTLCLLGGGEIQPILDQSTHKFWGRPINEDDGEFIVQGAARMAEMNNENPAVLSEFRNFRGKILKTGNGTFTIAVKFLE